VAAAEAVVVVRLVAATAAAETVAAAWAAAGLVGAARAAGGWEAAAASAANPTECRAGSWVAAAMVEMGAVGMEAVARVAVGMEAVARVAAAVGPAAVVRAVAAARVELAESLEVEASSRLSVLVAVGVAAGPEGRAGPVAVLVVGERSRLRARDRKSVV
jgi:hypothetical protein